MLCAASVSNQRRICSHSAGAFVLNRLSPCLIIWITRPKVNACNLRISNEPCTDKATVRRVELARKRRSAALDVYGECRDSEQKAKRLRACRQGELRPDRNHNSSKNCDFSLNSRGVDIYAHFLPKIHAAAFPIHAGRESFRPGYHGSRSRSFCRPLRAGGECHL